MRRLFLIPLLAAYVTVASAQRFGAPSHFSPRFAHHNSGSRSLFYPLAFYPDFDDSFATNSGAPQPSVLMQSPPQPDTTEPYLPAEPLLIELQGDRYVRISGEETSDAQILDQQSPQAARLSNSGTRSPAGRSRRAVLVFSDGHREELAAYTISGGLLYAEPDFYIDGSWTREVKLTALNLPETVHENELRDIRFQLPSVPNEVIVGP